MQIDYSKTVYLFDGLTGDIIPDDLADTIKSFLSIENIYMAATREIATKLENLNDEFKITKNRNPIHQIKTRVKTPKSIVEKLIRRSFEVNVHSARENLSDIGGVRVICAYIDDIYMIADMLISQDDIELIKMADYIKNPKPSGYRSLHLIVTVPVFFTNRTEKVKVEIQIRTIAMDFWASLEHDLAYKFAENKTDEMVKELKDCAEVIAQTDIRMQRLYRLTISGNEQPKKD